MITFFSSQHELHAPEYEFFRGERVPCFESPSRAAFVLREMIARGHEVRAPAADSRGVLMQIHTPRYLSFLETAWAQWIDIDPANAASAPFPSVWPVRTLRSDVEPTNFTARLGLYSMDNGSPLSAGTWAAAKAGADAAVSAAVNIHGDPATEYPFYLGHADEVGTGLGKDFNLNLPLPAGTTAGNWFAALEFACSRIERHRADALVVSLGLDTFAGDPISKFALMTDDFRVLGARLKQLGLPTVFILEGGYAATELGVNAANVLDAFDDSGAIS
jgi:acetoin utilization deacetylase AcuC-like enzyme